MNLNKIKDFINGLSKEDFFHYLSPTSHYNTSLKYSFCEDSYPVIGSRRMLELYFFLSQNQDEIIEMVYEKLSEFSDNDEEFEQVSVNWYVIIFYLLNWNWKNFYDNLQSGKDSRNYQQLIDLNENFERDDYYIFNDHEEQKSFYTKNIEDCIVLAADRDKTFDFNKLAKTKEYESGGISFKKGDYILFNRFEELDSSKLNHKFFKQLIEKYKQANREFLLSSILSENRILRYENFKLFSNR